MFSYYKVNLKLIREMLGTCPDASIYNEHILQKAKKEMIRAASYTKKVAKSLDKYVGVEISEKKEVEELKGIIRSQMITLRRSIELPDTIVELLEVAKEVEEEVNAMIKEGEGQKPTVFMKDENGWPIISSHMILGNFKAIMKVLVNNGDKSVLPTKTSIGEVFSLDVKVIEDFLRPTKDLIRDEEGKPLLSERPLHFDGKTGRQSAIALSEQLPIDTEFEFTLRVRESSPITLPVIKSILNYGKNLGLGQWRGSGNKGAYVYKIEELKNFKEDHGEWN